WMLDSVDSVRALVSILRRHEVFKEYEIISVAGDGKVEDFDGQKYEQDEETVDGRNSALERVKNAIKNNDKTITLTVGQLTTGVTVPEWTGVLMLSNVQSPALYMQTGFRSQNPYKWSETAGDGNLITYRKENAYLFDFDPERSLGIVDDFANNLISDTSDGSGTQNEREDNIKRLLNFFPVIGEDTDGEMVELDPKQVLAIPRSIKIREVVRRGFMSNLLFNNISAIFRSEKILDIIHKFPKSEEGKLVGEKDKVKQEDVDEVQVDAEGNIEIDEDEVREKEESIFGIKVFATEEVKEAIQSNDLDDTADSDINEKLNDMLMDKIKPDFMKMRDEYDLTHREREQKEAQAEDLIKKKTSAFSQDLKVRQADHRRKFEQLRDSAKSEEEIAEVEETIEKEDAVFIEETYAALNKELNSIVKEASHEVIREQEEKIEKKKKDTVEDTVRENLRGFSRSIPSFIMAYGDENLTLENFDDYVDKDVFEEVTGITLDEFRFLRDGDTHIDENGDEQYFEGGLFNENVFDGSIQEFLNKRSELSDYFEDNEESIYDYIPPQNTNQIYTPEWVVKKMVNQLEDENPGIYDDSSKTFIDLYMKSGLYITEVVKKLYNSEVIKSEIPDDYERLKHILENQVYGLAPTEIIYRIASNFIFSEQTEGISHKNFVHLDAYPYAEAETLEEKLDEAFE
ncbi:MAG: restriction endonuclease, partial [Atopostipes sp.]|nr:restriction endonuclease [Atopostipes sp.]